MFIHNQHQIFLTFYKGSELVGCCQVNNNVLIVNTAPPAKIGTLKMTNFLRKFEINISQKDVY